MKAFATNRINDTGIKMNKMFVIGLDEKFEEIEENLSKIQENIKVIIE